MKRVIFFVILLIALLTLTICEQIFIDKTINKMLAHINYVQATVINNENSLNSENVLNSFYDMRDFWEDNEGTMAFYIDHKNIASVGQALVRLLAALEENDIVMSKTEIYLLHEEMYVLKKISAFNIHNIF